MQKIKNSWARFWTRFWDWFKGEDPAKLLLLVGGMIVVFTIILLFCPDLMPEKYKLDYKTAGKAGIALLGLGVLLFRAVSSDKIADAQQKAEKNQRLAGAIKLMASMEKNARAGYLPDDKDDFEEKEVLHPDEMAQTGGIEILYQLMQEDQEYRKSGLNLLQDFILSGANKLDGKGKMQGGGYPLHKFSYYHRVGFNIQKALQVLGLEGKGGIHFNLSSLYLVGMDLNGVHFSGIGFINSDMSNCNLEKAHFTKCNLTWAYFVDCFLGEVHFTDCNLRGANFTNTFFFSAKISSARFKGANINACNFKGATIAKETLLEAKFKSIKAINGEKMSREEVEQFDKEEWDRIAAANLAKMAKRSFGIEQP